MIIDANKFEKNKIKTTVCIVGSGMGGSVSALEIMKDKQINLLVVESGSTQTNGKSVSHHSTGCDFKAKTREIRIGGTSNLWGGICSPLDRIDFEKRDWIPHSGWPIEYNDIEPHYKKVAHYFNIFDFGLYDKVRNNDYDCYARDIKNMPINTDLVAFKMFQQYDPPTRFLAKIKTATQQNDHQSLLYNATALELHSSAKNKKTDYLVCRTPSGKKIKVYADIFIIAAGALETPRLLLNSNSLDNSAKMVGKNLLDHPMANFIQVALKKPIEAHIFNRIRYKSKHGVKLGIRPSRQVQKEKKLPNHNFYLIPSFKKGIADESEKVKRSLIDIKNKDFTAKDLIRAAGHPNIVYQALSYQLGLNPKYKMIDLLFITEQVPNFNSKVSLSNKKDAFGYPKAEVSWQLSAYDYESMDNYFSLLKEIFPRDNFDFTHSEEDLNWKERFTSASHHLGTARMSTTARDGVVDINQKVFGSENIYICDASIFPTAGNANCSLSIAAFSHRLAEHIKMKLNVPEEFVNTPVQKLVSYSY
jgi:choline dehydrogenase-like flavoprotein